MNTLKVISILIAISIPFFSLAQKNEKPYEFSKITNADFETNYPKVDVSDGAIVIADVGESKFEGNNEGWFSTIYKHRIRIKIYDKKAFSAATVKIPLYKSSGDNSEEKLESLKAVTYNLVNEKVEEVHLEKANVFTEELDKNHLLKKFTMPAVKEGSIIEYSYSIKSDFLFNLQPWNFQGEYPVVWSEYSLNLPEYFSYAFLSQGYQPFAFQYNKDVIQKFKISVSQNATSKSETIILDSKNKLHRWAMANVPAIRQEPFSSNLENYLSKIEFQMSGQQLPNQPYREIMGDWLKVASTIMIDADFMGDFNKANNWTKDILKSLQLDGTDSRAKAKSIFDYVQNNFTSLGRRGLWLTRPLKEVARLKQGYAQEINLLLALLLKEAGLAVAPTLVSTKDHSFSSELYPLLNQYNYVVVKLLVDEKRIFLDAASKSTGFGKLPLFCYRNMGVSIQTLPEKENLLTESISEDKITSVQLSISDNPAYIWEGTVRNLLGYFESASIRNEIGIKSTAYEKKIKEFDESNITVDSIVLEKLKQKEEPLKVIYDLRVAKGTDPAMIYFSPVFKEGREQFFLKSAERNYPVELPHKYNESYSIAIDVPNGYVVDEVPKSEKINFNEDEAFFEYLVQKSASQVLLRLSLKINKTTFLPDDYDALKQFFDHISKKYDEQIVFKKL